jgi:hypothetical protein
VAFLPAFRVAKSAGLAEGIAKKYGTALEPDDHDLD